MTRNESVARVDGRLLSDLHILGLRLGDAEHRFEPSRLHDLRERGAFRNPLSKLQRQILKHTRLGRTHLQRPQPVLLICGNRLQLRHTLALRGNLRVDRLRHQRESVMLDAQPRRELIGLSLRIASLIRRHQLETNQ